MTSTFSSDLAAASAAFVAPRAFLAAVRSATDAQVVPQALLPFAISADPHNGFALPTTIAPVVLATGPDPDPMAARVRRLEMDSSYVAVPARVDKNHATSVSGGFVTTRGNPGMTPPSATRGELEQVILRATALVSFAYGSNRMPLDSPRAFAAWIEGCYRDELAAKLMAERLHGTGVGEFAGVVNDPATIAVAKEVGQNPDTLVGANIVKMAARCWHYAQAIWCAHPDSLGQLLTLKHPDTSEPLIGLPQREEDPFMLLGRPLYFLEHCAALGDRGDLVLGVWSEYLEGELIPATGLSSIHVRWLNRETCYQFFQEGDGKPWWRSTLTPKNGTTTLSPFVVLEARA